MYTKQRKILSNIESNNVGAGLMSAQFEITKLGEMINNEYIDLGKPFKNIKLHDYVIMPNHIHGIIEICQRADTRPAPTIGDIICSFKSKTTLMHIKGINKGTYKPFNKRLWQRNYYEHIIRNEKEYSQIQQYIQDNPLNWENDQFNY